LPAAAGSHKSAIGLSHPALGDQPFVEHWEIDEPRDMIRPIDDPDQQAPAGQAANQRTRSVDRIDAPLNARIPATPAILFTPDTMTWKASPDCGPHRRFNLSVEQGHRIEAGLALVLILYVAPGSAAAPRNIAELIEEWPKMLHA
jgi:hypothetical protein